MFDLEGASFHETRCKCSGCSPIRPALWAVYEGLLSCDVQVAKAVMKADEEDNEQDPFLSEELALAVILAAAFAATSARARPIIDRMFTPPVTEGGILRGLDEISDLMRTSVTPADERRITEVVERTLVNGALDSDASVGGRGPDTPASLQRVNVQTAPGVVGVGTILENAPSALRVQQGIIAASKYYTNNFFNTFIIPEITQRIELLLSGTPFNEVPDLASLRAILDRRLRTVPYWRLVANAAASRGYHYGYLKAAELRGVTTYMFRAVIDSRTSEICQFMNGKTFQVSTAARLMEKVADAGDVEQVKTLMPWRKYSDINGLSNTELEALGVMVPPLHGNCRSTLVIV